MSEAEQEAVALASSPVSAFRHVIIQNHANLGGVLDAAKLIGLAAEYLRPLLPKGMTVPYLAPHGLRTALRGVSAQVSKVLGQGFWLIWAAEIAWSDGVEVDRNIQRAVAADTIAFYVFDKSNIEKAFGNDVEAVQAHACGAYSAYISSHIVGDFIDQRSIPGLLRNLIISLTNPDLAAELKARLRIRRTTEQEMLGHAGALERWVATAHQPFAGIHLRTEPAGAQVTLDGEIQAGCTTPCSLLIEMSSKGPERHTVSVRVAGYDPVERTVELSDLDAIDLFIPIDPEAQDEDERGMLDCVFCIDKSGSMADDISAVQAVLDPMLGQLSTFASENDISLQLGLVTYTRHDDVGQFGPRWLEAAPLSPNIERIKQNIRDVRILGAQAGAGGCEDMYAALLCGMGARDLQHDPNLKALYGQPDGSGRLVDMGWRPGACKICIPIGDEPPSDPDWKDRTLTTVAERSANLDPVHMYPIVVQSPVASWLAGTKTAMTKLARRTGGQVTHITKAEELPAALVDTVKLAVRRHRNEVWRQQHPSYLLYGAIFGILGIIVMAVLVLFLRVLVSGGQRRDDAE